MSPALQLPNSLPAAAEEQAMTAGDLEQLCIDSSAESKAGCRFYLLGITQGISMGMSIADGKTNRGRPCVPDNLSASAIELAVKMKLGQGLMVYPGDRKLDASGVVRQCDLPDCHQSFARACPTSCVTGLLPCD